MSICGKGGGGFDSYHCLYVDVSKRFLRGPRSVSSPFVSDTQYDDDDQGNDNYKYRNRESKNERL